MSDYRGTFGFTWRWALCSCPPFLAVTVPMLFLTPTLVAAWAWVPGLAASAVVMLKLPDRVIEWIYFTDPS